MNLHLLCRLPYASHRMRHLSFLSLAAMLTANPALAQLTSAAPVPVAPPAGTAPVRWPDVAFSSGDDVFLAVSGAGNVQGQYYSASGAALGASFVVNAGTVYGQAPRVAYSAGLNAFLVTWHESIGNDTRIRGRIIRHGQAALTGDLDLSAFGTMWEMGATVAWSSTSNEFLIGWQDRATTHIHVQRVSGTGGLLGGVITVEVAGYERDPSIAYDPNMDIFLVAYAGCVGNDDCFVHAQRVQAGTGALVGTPIVLEPSVRAGYIPELAYNAISQRFLAVWFRIDPSGTGLYSRTIDSSATGPSIPVSTVASYDANSVAWNPISNTFVVVTHSSNAQDLAVELSSSGQPVGASVLFGNPAASGNFNPRVASSTLASNWLGVTSSAFNSLVGQRISSLTRDSGDAGVPEVDAGTPDSGAQERDAGTPEVDAGTETDAGTPQMDSGVPLSDAGSSDAGMRPGSSGGGAPDFGGNIGATGSCGCSGSPGLFGLLACVLWFRWRRT